MKAIKLPLAHICTDDTVIKKVIDTVDRANNIVTNVYMFIKLFVLHEYKFNKDISMISFKMKHDTNFLEIDDNFIKCAISAITFNSCSRAPKKKETGLYSKMIEFYKTEVANMIPKQDQYELSHILAEIVPDIVKNFKNNIKLHFRKHISNFIKFIYCKNGYPITNYQVKVILAKLCNKEPLITIPKNHTIGTIKYIHNLPTFNSMMDELTYMEKDICEPLSLIPYTSITESDKFNRIVDCIYESSDPMDDTFINTKIKGTIDLTFSFEPLKEYTSTKDFDKICKWLIGNENSTLYSHFGEYIDEFFLPNRENRSLDYDVKLNPFKYFYYMMKMNYVIAHDDAEWKSYNVFPLRASFIPKSITINTASLIDLFVNSGKKEKLNNIDQYKDELWKTYFEHIYGWTKRGKTNRDKKRHVKHTGNDRLRKLTKKGLVFIGSIKTDGYSASLMFDKEGKRGKFKVKKKKEENEPKPEEFQYLDDLTKEQLDYIKKRCKIVAVDPGKKQIVTMIDENGRTFVYSYRQRNHEMKSNWLRKRIRAYETKNMDDEMKELSLTNSKPCEYESFKKYVSARMNCFSTIKEKVDNLDNRLVKFKAYLNQQQSEDQLVKNIRKTFEEDGKQLLLMYGDWSMKVKKQLKNHQPTPGIGIRRKIHSGIHSYSINEYGTSINCFECEKRLKNHTVTRIITTKKGDQKESIKKPVELHSLLRCGNVNCESRFWNRDINGSLNILKMASNILNGVKRKAPFRPLKQDMD
jgi:hypothetical protein